MRLLKIALLVCGLLTTPVMAQTKGGDITTVLRADPRGLVLALSSAGDTQLVAAKIYEGLLNYSTDLNPEPSLAKSWEISEDGLTYTFKLQTGVKWSDGEPFSSADVVFSLTDMLPAVNAAARQALEEVKTVEAPDAETIVIALKKPVPYFLLAFPRLQMPIMPKHIYEGTDYATNPANETPIGTGPFKLEEWRRGSFIRLTRNEDYWNEGLPYVDSITYRIIPDAASRAIALETGDVQVLTSLDVSGTDIERFKSNSNLEMTPAGWEYYASLAMLEINLREPPLDDVRFRRALHHAIDRDFVLDVIWQGLGSIATGPVSSKIPFYTDDVPQYEFDVAKANALLDDIGLKTNGSGMRLDEDGNPIKIGLLILPGDPYPRLAEYVREAWRSIGIDVELQSTDLGNWYERWSNWNYDVIIATAGQFADPGIGSRRYYHSGNINKGVLFSNTSGYSDADVDTWYEEAGVEMEPAKRGELYALIQKKLVEDVAMIWLLELDRLTIHHKSVQNLVTDGFGPRGPWDQAYIAE